MSVELVAKLKSLKLHGMAQTWPELLARARHSALEPEHLLRELLAAENRRAEVRSIAYQMTAARFPARIAICPASTLPRPRWMRHWCTVCTRRSFWKRHRMWCSSAGRVPQDAP